MWGRPTPARRTIPIKCAAAVVAPNLGKRTRNPGTWWFDSTRGHTHHRGCAVISVFVVGACFGFILSLIVMLTWWTLYDDKQP